MTKDAIHAKASCKVRVIRRVSSIRLNTNYTVCYVGRSKHLHLLRKLNGKAQIRIFFR